MAIEFGPMPDFSVKQPPPFDAQAFQLKQATLSQLLNENKVRQQLAPLQVQEQQQKTQQAGIQTQLQQQELDSRKAMMAVIASGELNKYAGVETPDGSGFDAAGAYQHLTSKGVRPDEAGQYVNSWLTMGKNQAEISKNLGEAGKAQQDIREKTLKQVAAKLGDIGDMSATKAANALDAFRQDLVRNPKAYVGLSQQEMAELYSVDVSHLDALEGHFGIAEQVWDFHKSKAEAAGAEATAAQKARGAAAPTAGQLNNAVATLSTYAAIPQNMRVGLANEMKASPDWETLQKVQTRADAANESFQRSADARQQAMAMKDVGLQNLVAGKLVAEDEKLGSALDQTGGIRGLLDMSKGGNQAATNAALTRFAEHEIVEGGVKRMNQLEYENLATQLGSYGRKFQSWVDGGFKGQMPAATNAEIHTILDAEDAAANTAHERNVGYIQNRYTGKPAPPRAGASSAPSGPPAGATGRAMGSDGKMHWTDGKQDLGVAQ